MGVGVTGIITPKFDTDTYPVTDPQFQYGGFRNVDLLSDLDLIPFLRRQVGMLVKVKEDGLTYELKNIAWNYDFTDWQEVISGGVVYPTGQIPFGDGTTSGGITNSNFFYDPNHYFNIQVTDSPYDSGMWLNSSTAGMYSESNTDYTYIQLIPTGFSIQLYGTDNTHAGFDVNNEGFNIYNFGHNWLWATTDGSNGQALSTDGSGNLSFQSYLTTISGITAGGELDGTYPNPTLLNSAVIGKVLTGLNLTGGGTITSTDTILDAFGKVQNQISALLGGVQYEGLWNATTNNPTLISSIGTKGYYYVVSVAGSTNIDGITDWKVGDWIIFNGSTWDKVDNTDAVSSVNGYTGTVSLTSADITEVTNLYYTNTRARASISETITGIDYNNSTGVFSLTSGYVIPTTTEETNWNTAYGWGNHASAGYLTSVTSHNLLSSTHGDTVSDSVVRGDLIVGNATPKWNRLALGSIGKIIRSNGTDTVWSTLLLPDSISINNIVYATAANTYGASSTFLTDGSTYLSLGTTNTNGYLNLGVATATRPHLYLLPSTSAFTGTTDGMICYQNISGTRSLGIVKNATLTKIITKDTNPDLLDATNNATRSVDADLNGTLSASRYLIPYGKFVQYSTVTLNSTTETSLLTGTLNGSTTFFAHTSATNPELFAGANYKYEFIGSFVTGITITGTFQFRLKLGGNTVGDTGAITTATFLGASTTYLVKIDLHKTIRTQGAGGTVFVTGSVRFINTTTNLVVAEIPIYNYNAGTLNLTSTTALDTTANRAIDFTLQMATTAQTYNQTSVICLPII